jgi:hypothetical protein
MQRHRCLALFALLPIVLVACQDYSLKNGKDAKDGSGGTDTAAQDSADSADTLDSNETGEVLDSTDTGDTGDTSDTGSSTDTGEVATEAVYLNTSSELYSYDTATNAAVLIAPFTSGGWPLTDVVDIAIDLSGHMFGTTFSALYTVNPTTAECTYIADVAESLTGLTFVSDGRLVGAGSSVSFVDTTTGALTPLFGSGRWSTSGDIIGLPDGKLYWTVYGDGSGDELIQIDPNTGNAVDIGSTGTESIWGLGYADGAMVGFTDGGKVVDIDPATAAASHYRTTAGSWWGATTNPVLW